MSDDHPTYTPLPQKPAMAVVGAGAIGGVTAARLARASHDPILVCKHADTAALAVAPGLRLGGQGEDLTQPVRAVATVEELPGPLDLVFLATKATDMLDAARSLLPLLHDGSLVVSQQNGVCEPALASVLGQERVVGCVVGFGATMLGPAHLELTSAGEFVIGNIDGRPDPRLEPLAVIMGSVETTRVSPNIMGELYAKLIINSCINSLGAMSGMYLGQMLANGRAREIFLAIMREAMAVAHAMNLTVEPGAGGKLDYYRFLSGNGLASLRRHLMIRLIGFKYRRIKSSSLQSLERGRPTEIAYLNGYICDQGRAHGVATPVNQAVVRIVEDIQSGRAVISPDHFNDPAFAGL